jgi:protein quaking
VLVWLQEELNRGKPNWEHLNDELHVLITVEDTENRATMKMQRAVEEVKKLLIPVVSGFQPSASFGWRTFIV